MIRNIVRKTRTIVTTSLFLGVIGASAAIGFTSNNVAEAATGCDKVNIVYCGLTGTNDSSYISSFQNYYKTNVSGHNSSPTVKQDYTDLQSVYNWTGATAASVANMNTSNTKVGTLYRDGHITVDAQTVGTDAWVTARFSNGAGFTNVEGNVYARKTTTSFESATAPVLVYMQNNQMVFAVMTGCGNAVKATPVPPVVTPPVVTPVVPTPPLTPVTPPVVTTVAKVVTPPAALPNTGPGDIFGLFSGVAIAGTSASHILRKRRAAHL